ncbi:uncharacterized protein ALTATR162_LOCUS7823 [Alternaria atra]|uniref:Uncharacterized protein n=1 Tax=Alternaria atra TaxID=119953 RepID=A0A8J2N3X0_9PLEO|nr:uncharacterized protein ALTATR162_LOCUS7823 [Alternaria atra]CAG5174614.1 unnamed protein product [Alternaria atra]
MGNEHSHKFAQELDAWEDHLDGKFLTGLGVNVMDTLTSPGSFFQRATSRHIFPAGNSHCAIMVGPLLLENGMTREPGGANISRRPIPNFTANSSKDLQEFLFEPQTYISVDHQEVPAQRHLSFSSARRLYESKVPVRNRQFASCLKQLSGGMFTGYCERFLTDEEHLVNMFLECAKSWASTKNNRRLNQSEYRAKLKSCAKEFTDVVSLVYGEEVNLVLYFFAFGLVERVKLSYNRVSNNCQDFCGDLLFRRDADNTFGLVYPPVPPNVDQIERRTSARYLMSFSGRMVHPHNQMPFVNPLASATQLYDSFGQNDADIIDHVSSIRFKDDPNGFHLVLDHLLDGPQDNLSVLTMHIHRDRNLYTTPSEDDWGYEDFLVTLGREAWIRNRLEVLHRLHVLNTALGLISSLFQQLTTEMTVEEAKKIWNPPPTLLGRAWSSNKRSGRSIAKPTWHDNIFEEREDGLAEIEREETEIQFVLISAFTNPWLQSSGAWKVRLRSVKSGLNLDLKWCGVFSKHWSQCRCEICQYVAAEVNCSRILSYVASQENIEPSDRIYRPTHPDYVTLGTLEETIKVLGNADIVLEVLNQLSRTTEYYGMDKTRKLLEPFGPYYSTKASFDHPRINLGALWGLIVYRIVYGLNTDATWALILENMREALSDTLSRLDPDLVANHDLMILKNEAKLLVADLRKVQKTFRAWVADGLTPRLEAPRSLFRTTRVMFVIGLVILVQICYI